MFRDPKTTIIGLVGAAAVLIKSIFSIDIPQPVTDGFIAVVLFLLAMFAKDSGTK